MTRRLLTVAFAFIVVIVLATTVMHRKRQLAPLEPPATPPTPVNTATVREG